ncbi:4-oxalocrotonate tautomerase family protein [Nocardia sp. JMUB6875]|uniref:tautomerase family protein n=1 Tax=Nocardia sp. JMUB6875 TaxID=3158170 RepID=UPI0032E5C3A0
MPYINVKVTREAVTPAQKSQIITRMTDVLVDILGKDPHTTFVVIDEVDLEDWGVGGLPVTEYRAQQQN